MHIKDYRTKYIELKQKALKAEQEFEEFKLGDYEFKTLYEQEKEEHLQWFVEHFDYIQRHKDYIRNSPSLSKIIIDFLPLFNYGGLVSGAGFCYGKKYKIYLGELLDIWDAGFCYHGCPIISYYARMHYNTDIAFQYIQNKKIVPERIKITGIFKHLPDLDPEIFKKITKANIVNQYLDMQTYPNIGLMMEVCK